MSLDSHDQRIPLGLIDPNPDNPRKTFHRLADLAATIESLGLLQNLLVVPKSGGRFVLRDGERRLRAMKLLVERKSPGWTENRPISCQVLEKESVGELEAFVANGQRESLLPWDEGARLDKIVELHGLTADEIGRQIGKSRSYVTLLIRIARGLSPKIVPILIRVGSSGPNMSELGKLAAIIDKNTLGPDHERQRKWLESFLTVTPKRKRKYRTRQDLHLRLRKLEDIEMPEHARAIVDSVIRYMQGEEFVLPEFTRKVRSIDFVPTELQDAMIGISLEDLT